MATDQQTAEIVISTVWKLIGTAEWKLSYADWLDKLDAPDDDYWRDKWAEWKTLAMAVNRFDATTMAKIVS
jgi:hypothetical protein